MSLNKIMYKSFTDVEEVRKQISNTDMEFESRLFSVADEIVKTADLKVIRLCGPSCSGKTTAAKMLVKRLESYGKNVHIISIDDFFYDEEELLRIKNENDKSLDYDSITAIDYDELKRFTEDIFSPDKEIAECPIFSFSQRKRVGKVSYSANNDDVFIFEGIQAIYPEVRKLFEGHKEMGIFICPESVFDVNGILIYPNDLRLMRRLVRDIRFRSTTPNETIYMWGSVRKNENFNIFPYIDNCSVHIDSSMSYEIGVLLPLLRDLTAILTVESKYKDRILDIINAVGNVSPIKTELIPQNSLYKEFV